MWVTPYTRVTSFSAKQVYFGLSLQKGQHACVQILLQKIELALYFLQQFFATCNNLNCCKTGLNVASKTRNIVACARLSDSIYSGDVLKRAERNKTRATWERVRWRREKWAWGSPVFPQPPRVFRISFYWTTFHHYLGAWNRLATSLFKSFCSNVAKQVTVK